VRTGPPPLYHGTRRGFQRGGLLIPRSAHKGKGTEAPLIPGRKSPTDAAAYVYVTTSKIVAWVYAWHAVGRGRPRVLTVQPLSDVWLDPEHGPDMEAHRVTAACVLSVDFDPVVSEEDARTGWVNQT
jgi:hypothetical protein